MLMFIAGSSRARAVLEQRSKRLPHWGHAQGASQMMSVQGQLGGGHCVN
jgi:hypothetical protein